MSGREGGRKWVGRKRGEGGKELKGDLGRVGGEREECCGKELLCPSLCCKLLGGGHRRQRGKGRVKN